MNLEEFREYCLSLGEVEEKMPFAKMPGGESVLTQNSFEMVKGKYERKREKNN